MHGIPGCRPSGKTGPYPKDCGTPEGSEGPRIAVGRTFARRGFRPPSRAFGATPQAPEDGAGLRWGYALLSRDRRSRSPRCGRRPEGARADPERRAVVQPASSARTPRHPRSGHGILLPQFTGPRGPRGPRDRDRTDRPVRLRRPPRQRDRGRRGRCLRDRLRLGAPTSVLPGHGGGSCGPQLLQLPSGTGHATGPVAQDARTGPATSAGNPPSGDRRVGWIGQRLRATGIPTFSVLEGGYSLDLPDLVLHYLLGLEGR